MGWQINPDQTYIQFTVRHMMIRKVRGRFRKFAVSFVYDEENPSQSTVKVIVDIASIYTRDKQRDSYLRSSDFLNVSAYPKIIFASKRVELIDDKNGRLVGDLTIQDATHELVLNVRHTQKQSTRKRFHAKATLNRKELGLGWNAALEAGGWLVGDTINVDIQLEMIVGN